MVSWKLLKIVAVEPAGVLPEFLLEGLPAFFVTDFLAFEENQVWGLAAVLEVHAVVDLLHEFHFFPRLRCTLAYSLSLTAIKLGLCVDPLLALSVHRRYRAAIIYITNNWLQAQWRQWGDDEKSDEFEGLHALVNVEEVGDGQFHFFGLDYLHDLGFAVEIFGIISLQQLQQLPQSYEKVQ